MRIIAWLIIGIMSFTLSGAAASDSSRLYKLYLKALQSRNYAEAKKYLDQLKEVSFKDEFSHEVKVNEDKNFVRIEKTYSPVLKNSTFEITSHVSAVDRAIARYKNPEVELKPGQGMVGMDAVYILPPQSSDLHLESTYEDYVRSLFEKALLAREAYNLAVANGAPREVLELLLTEYFTNLYEFALASDVDFDLASREASYIIFDIQQSEMRRDFEREVNELRPSEVTTSKDVVVNLSVGLAAPGFSIPTSTLHVDVSKLYAQAHKWRSLKDAERMGAIKVASRQLETSSYILKGFGVGSEKLLKGLIVVESGGNPYAKSGVGARGFAQLMPQTAKYWQKKLKLPYSPIKNSMANLIAGAAELNACIQYMAKNSKDKSDFAIIAKAIAGYNSGKYLKAYKNYTWREIVTRRLIPMESIYHSILVRIEAGLPIASYELKYAMKALKRKYGSPKARNNLNKAKIVR